MVIDEDQDSVDEATEGKMEDIFKLLVSLLTRRKQKRLNYN